MSVFCAIRPFKLFFSYTLWNVSTEISLLSLQLLHTFLDFNFRLHSVNVTILFSSLLSNVCSVLDYFALKTHPGVANVFLMVVTFSLEISKCPAVSRRVIFHIKFITFIWVSANFSSNLSANNIANVLLQWLAKIPFTDVNKVE